jgi:thiopurine S-methyltransferase
MDKEFWLQRWQHGEIGFHQDEVNRYLQQHWQALFPERRDRVFVPLCGKSRDMLWLRQRGHAVLGVELSDIAGKAFFAENGYVPQHHASAGFDHCAADDIDILCGDFFDLGKDDLAGVSLVYDRASLVALPPGMRVRYATHLLQLLPSGTQILLLTFDYSQLLMEGPPFAVSRAEVESLYGDRADIRLLDEHDVLAQNPRFQARGLDRLQESIFLLTLK